MGTMQNVEHETPLTERANLARLQPTRDAMEMESVVTLTPEYTVTEFHPCTSVLNM